MIYLHNAHKAQTSTRKYIIEHIELIKITLLYHATKQACEQTVVLQ
jgi:hypothetical protein